MSAVASPGTVASLMANFRQGDRSAAAKLVELCFPELRRLAAIHMKSERAQHTWQPTVLVNEMYLELVKVRNLAGGSGVDEQEKAAFLGFAGHLMKRLLLHHARPLYRRVEKVEFEEPSEGVCVSMQSLGEVEEALSRLAVIDPRFRTVVEMRVFEGLTKDEIALQLRCSRRTVGNCWSFAKRWLQNEWAGSLRE